MIDEKINFQVWIVTSKQLEAINKLKRQYHTEAIPTDKLEEIEAGKVDLVLIPIGNAIGSEHLNSLWFTTTKKQVLVDS